MACGKCGGGSGHIRVARAGGAVIGNVAVQRQGVAPITVQRTEAVVRKQARARTGGVRPARDVDQFRDQ